MSMLIEPMKKCVQPLALHFSESLIIIPIITPSINGKIRSGISKGRMATVYCDSSAPSVRFTPVRRNEKKDISRIIAVSTVRRRFRG